MHSGDISGIWTRILCYQHGPPFVNPLPLLRKSRISMENKLPCKHPTEEYPLNAVLNATIPEIKYRRGRRLSTHPGRDTTTELCGRRADDGHDPVFIECVGPALNPSSTGSESE